MAEKPVRLVAVEVVARLQQERLRRSVSWEKFGALVGVPVSTLRKLDAGRILNPHQITLAKIDRALRRLESEPLPQ